MNGVQVWLWKNGDHYLGYTHLYPCDGNGDPLVLGEPVGKVVIKSSLPRDLFINGFGINNANTPMPQATASPQEALQAAEAEPKGDTKEVEVQGK